MTYAKQHLDSFVFYANYSTASLCPFYSAHNELLATNGAGVGRMIQGRSVVADSHSLASYVSS